MPTVMNGVSLNALTTVDSWSALSLFANGEQGVWYDPSDMSTMFQNTIGTTPAVLEQPVGLILDKSKNLALGSSIGSGNVTGLNIAQFVTIYSTGAPESGKYYEIKFDVRATSGSIQVFLGNNGSSAAMLGTDITTGSYKYIAKVPDGELSELWIRANLSGFQGDVTNISVRELFGNHASQSTSTSRPVLSARYNLLTKTEQIEDSIWAKGRCTVISNDQVAPDGTLTVDKISCTETGAGFFVWRTNNVVTVPVNTNITFSAVSKRGSRDQCVLSYTSGSSGANGINAIFNLATGTYVSTVTFGSGVTVVGTPTITDLGNGYYRMSLTVNSNTTSANPVFYPSITSSSDYSCISGVDFGYLWGTDLRAANDGVGVPVYQRVNTATDYDAMNFPPYLKFDGVDDSLSTGSINFAATDKMSVFHGHRIIGTAYGVLVNGPVSTYATFQSVVHDSAKYQGNITTAANHYWIAETAAIYSSPRTDISSILLDTAQVGATNAVKYRLNGALLSMTGAIGGSPSNVNFGNMPLTIGMYAGNANRFNGHLYGLIVRGALSNSTQIENAENYINSKTKAY